MVDYILYAIIGALLVALAWVELDYFLDEVFDVLLGEDDEM